MPRLLTTRSFERQLLKFSKKHPELREQYFKTITLLEANPFHPILRLHKLHGKLRDFYAVSINSKYRIMIDFIVQDDVVVLISIGSHSEVYGREWQCMWRAKLNHDAICISSWSTNSGIAGIINQLQLLFWWPFRYPHLHGPNRCRRFLEVRQKWK